MTVCGCGATIAGVRQHRANLICTSLTYILIRGVFGKSGGLRAIYYWIFRDDTVYMLVAYPKSRKDGLTREETAILAVKVKEL